MGFLDTAAGPGNRKNQSREARGHPSSGEAARDWLGRTKAGKKIASGRDTAGRISDRAKSAAGKDGKCAACGKKTKNGWVCSAKCAKKAGENF